MKIVFLGPPGAGKGTQAERVCANYKIAHISTGDILRAERKNKTPLGVQAQEYIDKGALVPDELIVEIVKKRVQEADCANGFLLDGFPRTIFQADALAGFVTLDAVVNIDVDLDRLASRITGRRVCRECGATYHVSTLSGEDAACAKCNGTLYQRDDDKIETVMNRLKVYEAQTKPLIEYYEAKGCLVTVDGSQSIDEVTAAIYAALEQRV